jgi:hypothetical protein
LFEDYEKNVSKLRPGFLRRPFYVEFMVNQVAVGQDPLRELRFILATIIPLTLLNLTPWSTVLFDRLIDPQPL